MPPPPQRHPKLGSFERVLAPERRDFLTACRLAGQEIWVRQGQPGSRSAAWQARQGKPISRKLGLASRASPAWQGGEKARAIAAEGGGAARAGSPGHYNGRDPPLRAGRTSDRGGLYQKLRCKDTPHIQPPAANGHIA
eukprot:gene14380-biopygen23117